MNGNLPQALDFIKTRQNRDGGWGYRPGHKSFLEPSAFCLLALRADGDEARTAAGLAYLRACQKGDGTMGIDARAKDGSWMAYAALLAFHALGAEKEALRVRDWILGFKDASGRFTPEDLEGIARRYRYDASIPGWPWTPGTTGWVEPTALFIIALRADGVAATQQRILSGVKLLLDRRVPSGGWNFGNPYSKAYELEAGIMSTALALAALGAAGVPESEPAVRAGLRSLKSQLQGDVSTASLAWSGLALKMFPADAGLREVTRARLARLQRADGSFRDNLFETSLAYLVLSEDPALRPSEGGRR
jgi:hypothetical protein